MKKLSRVFGRRPKDSSSTNGQSTSPLVEAPFFHQLSSSRLLAHHHHHNSYQRTLPSSTRLIADQVPEVICAICAGIDFPHLHDWCIGKPRPWIELSHVLEGEGEPACPYCAFFRAVLASGNQAGNGVKAVQNGMAEGSAGNFVPYLRIRLAFERLGMKERHELGKEVLIEVMARNKSLPWGYIVKAIDEEGTSIGGYLAGTESEKERTNGVQDEKNPKEVGIQGRTVTQLLNPELVKTWVGFCEQHHNETDSCGRNDALVEGLRLIDVETRHIVSVGDLDTISPEYVTLSYVSTVADRDDRTTSDEDGDAPTTVPDDISPLFTDAITFTKRLGYRYIWIDQYCFHSLPSDIKQRQTPLLGDVFAQSSLTLINASNDVGTSAGITGVSVARDAQLSLQTEAGLFTTSLLRPDVDVAGSSWASRAWTYHEGLFARRRLVFTSSQVYFQCRKMHCHESLSVPLSLAPDLNLGRVFPQQQGAGITQRHLQEHIKTFMSKDVPDEHSSLSSSRLDAFRSVLHHYRNIELLPIDSLLGLPLFHHSSLKPPPQLSPRPPPQLPTQSSTHLPAPDPPPEPERVISQTDRLAVALTWHPMRTKPPGPCTPSPYILDETLPFPSWSWLPWHPRPVRQQQQPPIPGASSASPTPPNHTMEFHNEACAPPHMEISIGFADPLVLSWEIDGETIRKKPSSETHIRFLRVRSYVFTLLVARDGDMASLSGVNLSRAGRDAIKGWFRAEAMEKKDDHLIGSVDAKGSADEKAEEKSEENSDREGVEDGEYELTGVLLAGRKWKDAGEKDVTVLVCRRMKWTKMPSKRGIKLPSARTDVKDGTKTSTPGEDKEEENGTEATEQSKQDTAPKDTADDKPGTQEEGTPQTNAKEKIHDAAANESDEGSRLVRLGALKISYQDFTPIDDEEAVLEGVELDGGDRGDIHVELREVDIY